MVHPPLLITREARSTGVGTALDGRQYARSQSHRAAHYRPHQGGMCRRLSHPRAGGRFPGIGAPDAGCSPRATPLRGAPWACRVRHPVARAVNRCAATDSNTVRI